MQPNIHFGVRVISRTHHYYHIYVIIIMDDVQVALALSLIAQRNVVIQTNDVSSCIKGVGRLIKENFGLSDVVEIDLLQCQDNLYSKVTRQMVKLEEGSFPTLIEAVIWKNLELLDLSIDRKSSLIQIFDELEQYNSVALRKKSPEEPFPFGEFQVKKPEMHLVTPILNVNYRLPQNYQAIKNRFWFAQSCYMGTNHSRSQKFKRLNILNSRQLLSTIYTKPSVQEYICSLLVFTRSHRLCSIAPLTTRPSFVALDGIMILAKCLALWSNTGSNGSIFVTPDHVKVAYRKIGYWLVDWETNNTFNDGSFQTSYQKKMEISILTGDWYGSEWTLAEKYLQEYKSILDWSASSGYTNKIVDEVLGQVMPPI